MGNGKSRFRRFLSYAITALLASVLTMLLCTPQSTKLQQLSKILQERFIGQVDQTAMEDAAARAMVASLGDRWSYYISAKDYEAYDQGKKNVYVGIGVTIQIREDEQGFDVLKVEPGGSALDAGILPGDILTHVNGQSVVELGTGGARELIQGKEGTEVTVTVLREGERLDFTLKRKKIQVAVATGAMLEDHIGYIQIANFNENCAAETIKAIQQLKEQGAKALVFDVRNNPGGYLSELAKLLDHLLPEGLIFQSVDYSGKEDKIYSDEACLEMPMAVLVNGESYSAAEFFAAALEEFEWATVVGEQTCGKGYFQTTYRLGDGSAVGLSIGEYFTPKGVSLAKTGGLVPEVTVEVDEETAQRIYTGLLDLQNDPQIQAAVDFLLKYEN